MQRITQKTFIYNVQMHVCTNTETELLTNGWIIIAVEINSIVGYHARLLSNKLWTAELSKARLSLSTTRVDGSS